MIAKPSKTKKSKYHLLSSVRDTSVQFVEKIDEVLAVWNKVSPSDNIFCQAAYLRTLELSPPKGVKLAYLIFYKEEKPVGSAVLQVQYFKASQNIRYEDTEAPGFFKTMARFFRNLVASYVEFHTLVCGNILLTGEHGFYFIPGTYSTEKELQVLDEGLDYAQQIFEKQGVPIAGNLLKDYFEQNHKYSNKLTDLGYCEFQVQPNMMLYNVQRWENFDAYLASLIAKYRTRYKRARKKAKDVRKETFSLEQIEANEPRLFELYNGIADNSGFNLVNLNENYLSQMKRQLGDNFQIYGYYFEEKLVGFHSTIRNYHELEAHFLGFEPGVNRSTQLYLNILYNILEEAIELQVKEIVYARTAMEIKSSVGAVGVEMHCYLKHQNQFTNQLLPSILDLLKPTKDWKPRQPFKEVEIG